VRRGQSRWIELLPLLFCPADPDESRPGFRLYSFRSTAACGRFKRATVLPHSNPSESSPTTRSFGRAANDVREMQLGQRSQGHGAAVGDTRRGHRSAVYVFTLASFLARQRSK
jgi:hypothetical protein